MRLLWRWRWFFDFAPNDVSAQDDDVDSNNEFGDGLSFDDSELESEDTDALFDDDPMYINRVVTLW